MKNKEKLKILMIGKFMPPPYGGIEQHVLGLYDELKHQVDYKLILVSKNNNINNDKNIILVSSLFKYRGFSFAPLIYLRIKSVIDEFKPDLIHIHSPNPLIEIYVNFFKRIPIICTWHSDIVGYKYLFFCYKFFQKIFIRKITKFIIPTKSHLLSFKQLKNVSKNKICIIPLGIDYDYYQQKTELKLIPNNILRLVKKKFILSVGRLVKYKNYEKLISAFKNIRTQHILIIAGNGPELNKLKKIIKLNKLEQKIFILTDCTKEVLRYLYQKSTFFILPSNTEAEAFGLSSAEAMASGKSTVVCNLNNGVNVLNVLNKTSLYFNDSKKNHLKNQVELLLKDTNLRKSFEKNAKLHIKNNFTIKLMAKKTLNLYYSLKK